MFNWHAGETKIIKLVPIQGNPCMLQLYCYNQLQLSHFFVLFQVDVHVAPASKGLNCQKFSQN